MTALSKDAVVTTEPARTTRADDVAVPRSLRWRLWLMVALILVSAVLALAPGLLPTLSTARRDNLLGFAIGIGGVLALVLLIIAIPGARRLYFQLMEAREQYILRDKRICWLSAIALVLYIATLVLARWALARVHSPALVIALGLIPMLAMALYSAAIVLHLRQLDELMRKIELESWALATLVVSQAYFAAWVLMQAEVLHIDASMALLSLGVWLLVVRTGVYVWLMRRYL